MPAAFDFPIGTDIWQPLPMTTPEMSVRGDHTLYVLGRLRHGVSEEQALAELGTIGTNLERQYPATNEARSFNVVPFTKDLSGGTRDFVSVLMWAAVFVLLLACANVANLQLARVVTRQKELAIRIALGASRWRIHRQVLVESLMVSLAGGAVGLLVAVWGITVTKSAVPPFIVQHIAGVKNIRLDRDVLVFAALVAALSGVLAGLFPALQSWISTGLYDALKAGTRSSSAVPVSRRLRSVLVVSEVALALVLLVGAGLMVKGFDHLLAKYPGFEEYGVLSARITLAENKYSEKRLRANFYAQALDRLSTIPGVESASAVRFVPNGWAWQSSTFTVENASERRNELNYAGMQAISANYFSQLRIPMRQGRAFESQDGQDSQFVVIVSESVARRLWPAGDAVGHAIRFHARDSLRTIVGVVADIDQSTMSEHSWPTAYVPIAQAPPMSATFLLRTERDPFAIAADARQAVSAVDPFEALYDFRTLRQLSTDNSSGIAFSAHMMMAFGVIALMLAAAGIYAVMAYTVNQRVHEIGVCMAIGAQRGDVLRMVLGDSLKLTAIGLAAGLPLAIGLSHVMAGFLIGVVRLDIFTFGVFAATLALVAAGAGYIPARRATRVDPMVALNCE
jgi:putative ABC transport system permease protein